MSNARHTPEVGALVQKHIDERTVMEAAGNWNHNHALRQVKELLALADSLETQRDAALERERVLRGALERAEQYITKPLTGETAVELVIEENYVLGIIRAALAAKGEK